VIPGDEVELTRELFDKKKLNEIALREIEKQKNAPKKKWLEILWIYSLFYYI